MKNILIILTIICGFPFAMKAQSTSDPSREYLLEKLVFYYVDNVSQQKPSSSGLSAMEIDKVAISNNQDIESPLWTNANNQGLKNLLIKLLRPTSQGGDNYLQWTVRNVLLITGKKVLVYLYNDYSNVAFHGTWPVACSNSNYPTAHSNASWPCASTFTNRSLSLTGHIGIGAYFFHPTRTAGGWTDERDKGAIFIHELVHTQLPLTLENTLGGTSMYGNGGHSFTEMIPSRNSAFNEGIANAFGLKYRYFAPYNMPRSLNMTSWFNLNYNLYVDNISGCSATSTAPHCLQARLTAASVNPQASCGVSNANCYKIRDVPANLIMYNENVTGNLIFQYMHHFGNDLLLVRDIKTAASAMQSTSNYTFAPLFKEMVKTAKNYRNPRVTSGGETGGEHLAMGILDFYTGYKLNNKATLGRVLGVTWDNSYTNVDDYFSTKRNELQNIRFNNTTWAYVQLRLFAERLNVREPRATSAPENSNN